MVYTQKLIVTALLSLLLVACTHGVNKQYANSSQYHAGEFQNAKKIESPDYWPIIVKYWRGGEIDNVPAAALPVNRLSAEDILALPDNGLGIVKFGHSTVLIKAADQLWLTDPVFSMRASPFSFAGPKRFHSPPISIEELPPLTGVIISHNHYDHLDKAAISQLKNKVEHFLVPLGLASKLIAWGVSEDKIHEFDWWQSISIGGTIISAAPAQHFSGRGLFDRNDTLWASWVIETVAGKIYFSGDGGYFSGFKEIGQKFGPFDLVMLEVGAYDPLWPSVHMLPEQAVQAALDLGAGRMMPIHNGTFDLAFHPWYEPLEASTVLGQEAGLSVLTPVVGRPVKLQNGIGAEPQTERWWRGL